MTDPDQADGDEPVVLYERRGGTALITLSAQTSAG